MEEFGKVTKEKNGSDWEYWDENGDKSQGDAVKSWTLLVMDNKNDGVYPAKLRCTDSSRYLSTRYSELYWTTPAARDILSVGSSTPLDRNWWLSELQGVSLLLHSCINAFTMKDLYTAYLFQNLWGCYWISANSPSSTVVLNRNRDYTIVYWVCEGTWADGSLWVLRLRVICIWEAALAELHLRRLNVLESNVTLRTFWKLWGCF